MVPGDLKHLANLHLDHKFDLEQVCRAWKQAMPPSLETWHDGVDPEVICHLLFGVLDHPNAEGGNEIWKAAVSFRCGQSKSRPQGTFCHDTRYKHTGKITMEQFKC